ncbi:hypothetical protein P154DRAFT_281937 [Amniculicola lignicola CBS 123094]|uniref:Secreted protein n=1 Tax=Amniculicola lignicola CBS 123094 TaxID=1392246 RepID=A0A6A5WDW0_9PLEO|nr:hypothetical protein P154DRAFT_281937 [Amniculicola lignicola CBS 123094]
MFLCQGLPVAVACGRAAVRGSTVSLQILGPICNRRHSVRAVALTSRAPGNAPSMECCTRNNTAVHPCPPLITPTL